MNSQAKVKAVILLAIVIMIALFSVIGFQLYKIIDIKREISSQQQTISKLQQQIDYYEKAPDGAHDNIVGDN